MINQKSFIQRMSLLCLWHIHLFITIHYSEWQQWQKCRQIISDENTKSQDNICPETLWHWWMHDSWFDFYTEELFQLWLHSLLFDLYPLNIHKCPIKPIYTHATVNMVVAIGGQNIGIDTIISNQIPNIGGFKLLVCRILIYNIHFLLLYCYNKEKLNKNLTIIRNDACLLSPSLWHCL